MGADSQRAGGDYYNLMGQKVDSANMPPGIYIHGGKKVIISRWPEQLRHKKLGGKWRAHVRCGFPAIFLPARKLVKNRVIWAKGGEIGGAVWRY